MPSLVLVWGTRPEALKLGPVAVALDTLGVSYLSVATGQHTTLLAGTPAETDLRGSLSLGLASDGNVTRWTAHAQPKLDQVLREAEPKLVVVQGDTMSAHVGALTANAIDISVAHVEAGVRSHDLNEPWPEEPTRVAITEIATWHLAATSTAYANLIAEGVDPRAIRVTGNTVVSALARYAGHLKVEVPARNLIVVTMHRREIQARDKIVALVGGVLRAAELFPSTAFVWPVHPAVARLAPVADLVQHAKNVRIVPPLGYEAFVRLVVGAKGVITDSGGLVEECATLGVPCVIARLRNDRPEAVEAGVATQVKPTSDGLVAGVHWIVRGGCTRIPTRVYGDADAAMLVARELARLATT